MDAKKLIDLSLYSQDFGYILIFAKKYVKNGVLKELYGNSDTTTTNYDITLPATTSYINRNSLDGLKLNKFSTINEYNKKLFGKINSTSSVYLLSNPNLNINNQLTVGFWIYNLYQNTSIV